MNGHIKCAVFMQGILFVYKKDSKEYACNVGDPGSIPGWGRPLERGMATHASILAWRILRTEELAGYSP